MVVVGMGAQAAFTDAEWDAFVDSSGRVRDQHRREAARLLQRAEVTRMTAAEQIFWFGSTHRDRAERHLRWARDAEEAVARLADQRAA
jgi:hypothetical protein